MGGGFVRVPAVSQVRGNRPGKQFNLTEAEIRGLCLKCREIFISQPILLELEAPIKIVGTRPQRLPFAVFLVCVRVVYWLHCCSGH